LGCKAPHIKFGLDPLKTMADCGEQRTDRFSFIYKDAWSHKHIQCAIHMLWHQTSSKT